jgi:hypothetical protein
MVVGGGDHVGVDPAVGRPCWESPKPAKSKASTR